MNKVPDYTPIEPEENVPLILTPQGEELLRRDTTYVLEPTSRFYLDSIGDGYYVVRAGLMELFIVPREEMTSQYFRIEPPSGKERR